MEGNFKSKQIFGYLGEEMLLESQCSEAHTFGNPWDLFCTYANRSAPHDLTTRKVILYNIIQSLCAACSYTVSRDVDWFFLRLSTISERCRNILCWELDSLSPKTFLHHWENNLSKDICMDYKISIEEGHMLFPKHMFATLK